MRSMAVKLVAAFAVVALVGVLIVAFLANRLTSTAFGSYVEQGVLAQDQRIADYIVEQYAAGGWRGADATLIPISHSTGTRLVVADPSGKVVADSSGRLTNSPIPRHGPRAEDPHRRHPGQPGGHCRRGGRPGSSHPPHPAFTQLARPKGKCYHCPDGLSHSLIVG